MNHIKNAWLRAAIAGLCALTAIGLVSAVSASTASAAATPHKSAAATPHKSAAATPHKKPHKKPRKKATAGAGDVSGATWMHDLAARLWDRKLTDIVIPGSHDSATYGLAPPADDMWHAQDENLAAQLNGGIRELDIRVERHEYSDGWDYYAHHGQGITDGFSDWLTLNSIFSSINQWAVVPGHEQEIIMLNLSIAQNGGAFPEQDCKDFVAALGGSLVTPAELQAHFGTTDPGQVTLGQLWSLPDPRHAARVIMDNTQCMNDAVPYAGQWSTAITGGLFSGYYADQCTAGGIPYNSQTGQTDQEAGIQSLVLQAARYRAAAVPNTAEPVQLGEQKVGGLWLLQISGTPEADCLRTPSWMRPDEQQVLVALADQWLNEPDTTQQSVNVVAGDFVQDTALYQDVIAMDETYPEVADAVTRTGAEQVTATQDDVTVPASAFAALVSYQGAGIPGDVTYQVSGPGGVGLGPQKRAALTVQANGQGVANPGADLYLSGFGATGTWTVTAFWGDGSTLAVPKTTWTVAVVPDTGFDLKVLGGPFTAQAGQAFADPSDRYSFAAEAINAHGGQLPDVPVTFDAGSAGTFPGGSNSATPNTSDTWPVALAPPFTAGTRAGTFPISVTAPGAANTLSLPFTITPGPATTFVVTQGGGQSAPINTKFPAALKGHWADQYGNVVTDPPPADRELTLSPSSGATWPNGQGSVEVTPGADGTITAPDLTAGHTVLDGPGAAHSLIVQAGPASGWTLDVTPGPAANIAATSGDGQQTAVGKPFAQALAVKVTDAAGNPVPGAAVTFQVTTGQATFALPPGAAAYFGPALTGAPPPTSAVVAAGSDGVATAPVLTAGQQPGPIEVTASAGAAPAVEQAVFHLSATGPPTAPAITGLTNGDGQVTVAFSGASAGGAPITSYTVSATDQNHPAAPPVTATGPSSPITVKGLTNGDPYVFTVTATSADGTSPPSAPSGALNVGVPPAFTAGPADGIVGKPYSSGFTVTGAPRPTVTLNPGTGDLPPGLTLGSGGTLTGTPTQAGSYQFTVQADNPVGLVYDTVTVTISPATVGGEWQLRATFCTTPAGHEPACAVRTLTGTFPPLSASAAATLVRGTVTYAAGRVTANYGKLTFRCRREIPAGSYTLILRRGHHAITVPVTIR